MIKFNKFEIVIRSCMWFCFCIAVLVISLITVKTSNYFDNKDKNEITSLKQKIIELENPQQKLLSIRDFYTTGVGYATASSGKIYVANTTMKQGYVCLVGTFKTKDGYKFMSYPNCFEVNKYSVTEKVISFFDGKHSNGSSLAISCQNHDCEFNIEDFNADMVRAYTLGNEQVEKAKQAIEKTKQDSEQNNKPTKVYHEKEENSLY